MHRIATLLALAVLLPVASCGGAEPATETQATPGAGTEARTGSPRPPHAASRGSGPGLPEPAPPDPRLEEARRRFVQGVELYEQGNAAAAVIEFRASYELEPASAILFNIATCQEHVGDLQGALDTYKRYLATSGGEMPDYQRRLVLDEIHELEQTLGLRP